ncbi:hypothetical protein V2G26_010359 [Clonostachys chloroleuca]
MNFQVLERASQYGTGSNNKRIGYAICGDVPDAARKIMTEDACHFLEFLQKVFEPTRQALLHQRKLRQKRFDAGKLPDFLPETKWVRNNETWQGARPAPGLIDHRLEITGPAHCKAWR